MTISPLTPSPTAQKRFSGLLKQQTPTAMTATAQPPKAGLIPRSTSVARPWFPGLSTWLAEQRLVRAERLLEKALVTPIGWQKYTVKASLKDNFLNVKYTDTGKTVLRLLETIIQLKSTLLGPNHPELAQLHQDAGFLSTEQAPVNTHLESALAIRKQHFGENSPEVMTTHLEWGRYHYFEVQPYNSLFTQEGVLVHQTEQRFHLEQGRHHLESGMRLGLALAKTAQNPDDIYLQVAQSAGHATKILEWLKQPKLAEKAVHMALSIYDALLPSRDNRLMVAAKDMYWFYYWQYNNKPVFEVIKEMAGMGPHTHDYRYQDIVDRLPHLQKGQSPDVIFPGIAKSTNRLT